MKILVTGTYGQLGSEIKDLSGNYPGWEFSRTDIDTLDITDEAAVDKFMGATRPAFVVNCAAYTAVDKAEEEPELAFRINAEAPGILASSCKKYKARLIHISTDYVFDGKGCKPYTEEDRINPQGVYGQTKAGGEKNCLHANPDTIIIRTSWLYSSHGNNFVKTMVRLGREQDSLNVVSDQVGSPTYAGGLALAVLRIIENSHTIYVPGIFHYSDEGVCSWYDFAIAVHEMANIHCKINPVNSGQFPAKAKRPHYSVLDKSKIKSEYKTEIPYWRDSLKNCISNILKE